MARPHAMRTVGLLTAVLATGCTRQADVAVEERVIRDLDKQWVQSVASRDTDAIAAVYAEDAVFMAPNQPRASGRAAIRESWAGLLRAPNLSLTFEPDAIVVSAAGDIAYDIGTYRLGMDAPRRRIEDVGKYVVAWKKVSGHWKVAADIFNSDRAAAP